MGACRPQLGELRDADFGAARSDESHGLRGYKGALIVPLFDAHGTLGSLQFISPRGAKRFLKGGRVAGHYFVVGTISDTVREAIAAASTVKPDGPPGQQSSGFAPCPPEWPDVEPLTEQFTAHPYPVDAVPALMREAVTEVQAFVQAPAALVARSALSVLSLAA